MRGRLRSFIFYITAAECGSCDLSGLRRGYSGERLQIKLIVISEAMLCIPFSISEVIPISERVLSAMCVVRGGVGLVFGG